eukprot:Skav203872  [mRNA]  locus=scaffold1031:166787:167011:+ [translate_table: standard]
MKTLLLQLRDPVRQSLDLHQISRSLTKGVIFATEEFIQLLTDAIELLHMLFQLLSLSKLLSFQKVILFCSQFFH